MSIENEAYLATFELSIMYEVVLQQRKQKKKKNVSSFLIRIDVVGTEQGRADLSDDKKSA